MRVSAGGPLAAFLMVAPLVAIPVFAVVGIPQFAPAVSSAVGDDEIADPGAPQAAFGKSAPAAAVAKPAIAPATGVDDLFAPAGTGKTSANSAKAIVTARPDTGSPSTSKSRNISAGRANADGDTRTDTDSVQWIPPAEALDGWAVDGESDKPSREALKETAKEVSRATPKADNETSLDDLPPAAPAAKPRSSGGSQPPVDDGWGAEREESPAPATRKPAPRAAVTKRKKSAAPAESALANVPDPRENSGVLDGERPVPKARGTTPPKAKVEVKTALATSEKISLAEFTQGLIHPVEDAETPAPRAKPLAQPGLPSGTTPRKPLAGRGTRTAEFDEPMTWEAATQRLKELGINKYTLDALPGEGRYLFVCQLTPANNPSVRRKFEDVADEPLLAVQKVLRQIDEWQSQR